MKNIKVSFIWRMISAFGIGIALGVIISTIILVPHLKPDVTISQIYKRRVKVQDQASFESNMNVEDITQEENETKNKKNRTRRRDR